MATPEQIELMQRLLEETQPPMLIQSMNETRMGIGAVLRCLDETQQAVTAGWLSQTLGVTTARVAVLLKKMEAKNLIRRERSPRDARVTLICLTEHGSEVVAAMREELAAQIGITIDHVGMDRMLEFIEISREIQSTMVGPTFDFE